MTWGITFRNNMYANEDTKNRVRKYLDLLTIRNVNFLNELERGIADHKMKTIYKEIAS